MLVTKKKTDLLKPNSSLWSLILQNWHLFEFSFKVDKKSCVQTKFAERLNFFPVSKVALNWYKSAKFQGERLIKKCSFYSLIKGTQMQW